MTMNIHSKEGDKVIFAYPENGWKSDGEYAKRFLEVDNEYTVDCTVIYSSTTDVYLKEFPEIKFNSVLFENK